MKRLYIILFLVLGAIFNTSAQTAQQDLTMTGNYHINLVLEKGQMTISGTFANHSQSDYKDIVYTVQCIAADGTVMSSTNYEWYNFIGHGTTKKLKEATYPCPSGCKTIKMGIVRATKLVAQQ